MAGTSFSMIWFRFIPEIFSVHSTAFFYERAFVCFSARLMFIVLPSVRFLGVKLSKLQRQRQQHSLICYLCAVRLLWWKGGRKENHATTVVCKQTNFIVQGGARFASPRNVFPRLDSVSTHVSGFTTAARSVLPFITAVAQKGFLALVNNFFALNAQSYHFSYSSNERMTN